jgi:hypothetical protein
MTKITVVCSSGVGDAVILKIVSHHLLLAGFDVGTFTPHHFGKWESDAKFGDWRECDAIFLQHDNGPKSKEIQHCGKEVYTFYGSYNPAKHPPLRPGYDFVSDLNQTMVQNVIAALKALFNIDAGPDNGLVPPPNLTHRKYIRRVAIHTTSGHPSRNWPLKKFQKIAKWLESQGYSPEIMPPFPTLEDLTSFIYESGYLIGNDSGPGHIASLLKIPHLIIGREEKHMRHWRPGWLPGTILTPPTWIPNWKGLRLREREWKRFVPTRKVIKELKKSILI